MLKSIVIEAKQHTVSQGSVETNFSIKYYFFFFQQFFFFVISIFKNQALGWNLSCSCSAQLPLHLCPSHKAINHAGTLWFSQQFHINEPNTDSDFGLLFFSLQSLSHKDGDISVPKRP